MDSEADKIVRVLKFKGDAMKSLAGFDAALHRLNELTPARMTGRQIQTFLKIAVAHARGQDVTMTEIREAAGEVIGHHMNRSYQLFLPVSVRNPDGLGWISQSEDPLDGRRKYLRLTAAGEEVALNVAKLAEGAQ